MQANVRTKVPAQAGRGENCRVDADGEQAAGRAEHGVVHGDVVGALGDAPAQSTRGEQEGMRTSSRTQARLSSETA